MRANENTALLLRVGKRSGSNGKGWILCRSRRCWRTLEKYNYMLSNIKARKPRITTMLTNHTGHSSFFETLGNMHNVIGLVPYKLINPTTWSISSTMNHTHYSSIHLFHSQLEKACIFRLQQINASIFIF